MIIDPFWEIFYRKIKRFWKKSKFRCTTYKKNVYLCSVFEAKKYCFIFNLKEMKKLVLFFAVAFAMSFASCGNKAAESTEATDSVAVVEEVAVEVVDTVAVDSAAVDTAAAVVAE